MFIKLRAMLIESLDTEDEQLAAASAREIGYTDILVNINQIEHIFNNKAESVIQLQSGLTIGTKESINEIHEKINRAYSLPLLS